MNAIDIHAHAFPDSLAERAMQKLCHAGQIEACGDGTVAGLLASMDAAGIDVAMLCPIATKPGQADGIAEWCGQVIGPRIRAVASLHPEEDDPPAVLAGLAEAGFAGIKLHPQYQQFAADDQRAMVIYRAAAELGLFVVAHCGLDFAFPDTNDSAAPPRFARVMEAVDGLVLIATHMGGWRAWDQVRDCLIGRFDGRLYLETSFSLAQLPPEQATEMIHAHGTGRVLYGTDWPWNDQARELELLTGLELTEDQQAAVRWKNAADLLKL